MAGDHKCPVCNATFTRPQHVARHMRSHTGDRPYKCQHCGDQFARSDLLSRHVNKCHSSEKPSGAPNNNRRKGSTSATRATTSKQACDQCVIANLPCDGSNPCSKCLSRKCRCTFVKFHRQTAPIGPGHPAPSLSADKQLNHNPTFSLNHILPSEQYLISNPNNPSITLPGLSGPPVYQHHPSAASIPSQSDFSFSANSLYTSSDPHPPSDQDYSARYRELLYRTGVVNNPSNQSTGTTHPQSVRYNPSVDPVPTTAQDNSRFSLSTATWGASNSRQDRLDHNNGFPYNDNRPHSQHGYPLSVNQNFSTSPDLYDFRYNRHDSIDDSDSASISTSELGHSSDHSFYDSPTIPQGISDNSSTHGDSRKAENHERFSSAFGLMSLDDPNVVAGITSDGTPFFSNHNGESIVDEDVLMNLGKVNVPDHLSSGGITAAGMTPREAEFRDLREFWKQYIRTPLTGPNSGNSSFPLATPTPNNVHGQLEAPKPSSGKKLSRVASLPSVKTPPLASEIGHHQYPFNEPRNNNNLPVPNNYRSHLHSHMGPDDLQSYERAVLARKTNINLNLPTKRHGTTSGSFHHGRADDSAIPALLSSVPPVVRRRPSSSAAEMRASSTSSESDGGEGNSRPSFKRLPSTTLEPIYSKRALLSIPNGNNEEYAESNNSTSGNDQSNVGSTSESHGSYPASQDRHRRMSFT